MKRTKQRMVRYLTGLTLFCLAFFPAASATPSQLSAILRSSISSTL